MEGNIRKKMAEGIEGSKCVAVFMTQRYMLKANGNDEKGEDDNCYYEVP